MGVNPPARVAGDVVGVNVAGEVVGTKVAGEVVGINVAGDVVGTNFAGEVVGEKIAFTGGAGVADKDTGFGGGGLGGGGRGLGGGFICVPGDLLGKNIAGDTVGELIPLAGEVGAAVEGALGGAGLGGGGRGLGGACRGFDGGGRGVGGGEVRSPAAPPLLASRRGVPVIAGETSLSPPVAPAFALAFAPACAPAFAPVCAPSFAPAFAPALASTPLPPLAGRPADPSMPTLSSLILSGVASPSSSPVAVVPMPSPASASPREGTAVFFGIDAATTTPSGPRPRSRSSDDSPSTVGLR